MIAKNLITGDYGEGGSVLADHDLFRRSQGGRDSFMIAMIGENRIMGDYRAWESIQGKPKSGNR